MVTASLRAMGCYEEDNAVKCRDHFAELFIPDEKKEAIRNKAVRVDIKKMIPEGLYEYVIARTGYFDELFLHCLEEDIPQIVILGAGYDSRPYRFEHFIENTMIFEVDAAPTQEQKQSILKENEIRSHRNIRYVPLDFEQDDVMKALCQNGFQPRLRSLYIWEGVTFYLEPNTVKTVLEMLSSNSACRSVMSFDFQTIDPEHGLIDTGLRDEAINFGIPAGTIIEYLRDLGYSVMEHLDSEEMCKRYLTCSDGSRFGRIKPFMNIVQAEICNQ
jgi:methyltransferase (TIGR00027 family)